MPEPLPKTNDSNSRERREHCLTAKNESPCDRQQKPGMPCNRELPLSSSSWSKGAEQRNQENPQQPHIAGDSNERLSMSYSKCLSTKVEMVTS